MVLLLLQGGAGVAAAGTSVEVSQFLARTSGLDSTHTNAYTALINGLVTDGVWSKLDVLHVYATQDSTTAKLNLVSTSYSGIANGSPTFTADRGFTGVISSSTVYIDSQFTASSASSPRFVQNSAHLSLWNLTLNSTADYAFGVKSSAVNAGIMPEWNDTNAYCYVNGPQFGAVANSDPRGWTLANRSSPSAVQLYRNGSSIFTASSNNSTGIPNLGIHALGYQNSSSAHVGVAYQQSMISIGSSLSSTDATNFYNRLRTYMTAVGVP